MKNLITLVCTFSMISLLGAHAEISDSIDLEPLLPIRGTKLFTGIYYKVGMKAFPKGWMTWTETNNYVEVELDPTQLPNYAEGKPFQYDNQWLFGDSESGLGYTLTNRGKPMGSLLWVHATAGRGNHVSIYDDPESIDKMAAGGEWRNDALWIPVPTDEENYYKLENLAKRGSFLTWAYKMHNNFNYYIQMVSYDAAEDSKFSFRPAGVKLEAKVYDFKFAVSLDDILKRKENLDEMVVITKNIPNSSYEDITYTIDESTPVTDLVSFTFNESSLKMMRKTRMEMQGEPLTFDGGFEVDRARSIELNHILSLLTTINVARHTNVEASIYTLTSNNVVMPFTAKMQVVGLAERMLLNRPDKTREGNVPADVVEDVMRNLGAKGMKIISRTDDNLVVQVSGVLKGTIGLKMDLRTTVAEVNAGEEVIDIRGEYSEKSGNDN